MGDTPSSSAHPSRDPDRDLVSELVVEARELLEEAEARLLTLEEATYAPSEAPDPASMAQVFRAFHSIKGTAACVGLTRIVAVTHAAETLLDGLRSRRYPLHAVHVTVLCEAVDFCRDAFDVVETTLDDALLAHRARPLVRSIGQIVASSVASSVASVPRGATTPARPHPPLPRQAPRQTVRVDVERLDALAHLVGELGLAETLISHHGGLLARDSDRFRQASARLSRVTRDIEAVARSLRKVPLWTTFRKMHRLVRDLAIKQGKDATLLTEGEEHEVDRSVLDGLSDALVHLMRNAVDHGLEPLAERIAAGKPGRGSVTLSARPAGGCLCISVSDDGRGFDRGRILAKAVERRLVSDVSDAAAWTDERVFELALKPGFTTATAVTDVSGRGVGLDIARRNIEALDGRVEVVSAPGLGSTVTLRIPPVPGLWATPEEDAEARGATGDDGAGVLRCGEA